MNKKDLSERDICSKFINPAIESSGWNMKKQVRKEVSFTDGRIIVQGKLYTRGKSKRADYILYFMPNVPIVTLDAKNGEKSVCSFTPLEEQKAIVGKVNTLIGLCDALEQEVQQIQDHGEQLMQSVLRGGEEEHKAIEV
ncbi:MAG: hypothetical protein ABJO28_11295 [Maribacter dokdonensis]